jgi:sigma-E factor negative regulatory protein RseC
MAIEEGIVVKVAEQKTPTAWVKTIQSNTCKACASRDSCMESKGNEREVEALNLVNAKVGDLIQISIDTKALLKATFLLYVFPILCMLIGGIIGHVIGLSRGMANTSPISALVAATFFFGAMIIVRLRAGRMALKLEYRPKITRILSRANAKTDAIQKIGACGV